MKFLLSMAATVFVITAIISCNRDQNISDQLVSDKSKIQTENGVIAKMSYAPPRLPKDSVSYIPGLGERRFIKKATLNFKVNNVNDAVIEIENKTRALGGFVNYSRLDNIVQDSTCRVISQDSSMQTIHFMTKGFLVLRVPEDQLDSLLTALNLISTTMMHREITADDIRIQLYENQLSRLRSSKFNRRMADAIDRNGKKLLDIEGAERSIYEKEESADNAIISNLTLDDSVGFSSISVEIYQIPGIRFTEVATERKIPEYETPFFSRLADAISNGWQLIKELILFLAGYWSIIGSCILVYFVFNKYIHISKKIESH
jgi:Domain of unknown function (DUF4349)